MDPFASDGLASRYRFVVDLERVAVSGRSDTLTLVDRAAIIVVGRGGENPPIDVSWGNAGARLFVERLSENLSQAGSRPTPRSEVFG
jgi:hypothetical protein